MQFFAVAALTATLITGQFTYVPVMAGSTAEVEVSSLIPDNVTVEQPVPLSEISLPKSDMAHCHGWTAPVFQLREYSHMMWFFVRTRHQTLRNFLDGTDSRIRFTAA